MRDLENVRTFKYRQSRVDAGFKVRFVTNDGFVDGICRNISGNGLRAELLDPAVVETSGTLTLYHPARTVELDAKVTYVDGAESGFVFLFRSGWEREAVQALLNAGAVQWLPPAVKRLQ